MGSSDRNLFTCKNVATGVCLLKGFDRSLFTWEGSDSCLFTWEGSDSCLFT